MRAHPFEDTDSIEIPKANLRNLLKDLLQVNRHIAASLETDDTEQVTKTMVDIRRLTLEERMAYYIKNRVKNAREAITTFEGIEITPHYSFEDCPDIDILIVPSAEHNMDTDLEDERLINFVIRFKCLGSQFLPPFCT